ncbi:gasdermin-C isoform X1 [Oryctolagus cuniculus]|uniref:gasdermin-C isoform X1 n=1 Tax=Oryctolagus cuniculus TaxID=9986 RepID=UPI0038791F3C
MSSLFARGSQLVVRELGRMGELVPADSLNSAPRLRPFCVLRKKCRCHPWPWGTRLIPTDFSLLDLLEPGSPAPEVSRSQPIHIRKSVTRGVTGAVSVGLQGKVAGGGVVTHSCTLAVQTLSISPHTWEGLMESRKLRTPRPLLLRELQSRTQRERLYVVTEAVETLQDTTLRSLGRAEGTGQLSFPGLGHLKVQGQSTMDREKTVTVPQGSVVAYRVLQLVVEEDHWAVLCLPEGRRCGDAGGGEEQDFQDLRSQVAAQLQDLATLSPELRKTLLGALHQLLGDPQALQELEDTLEQALDAGLLGQLQGPGGVIVCSLQDPSGNLSPSRGRAFLHLLGALVVLSDSQQWLLAQVLERQILPQQLELVASILEANFTQREEARCSLPPEVLSALPSEAVVLALSLLESCGLELQGPGCQLSWDPAAVPQVSALYGCLEGLQLLAGPSPGPSQPVSEEEVTSCL